MYYTDIDELNINELKALYDEMQSKSEIILQKIKQLNTLQYNFKIGQCFKAVYSDMVVYIEINRVLDTFISVDVINIWPDSGVLEICTDIDYEHTTFHNKYENRIEITPDIYDNVFKIAKELESELENVNNQYINRILKYQNNSIFNTI